VAPSGAALGRISFAGRSRKRDERQPGLLAGQTGFQALQPRRAQPFGQFQVAKLFRRSFVRLAVCRGYSLLKLLHRRQFELTSRGLTDGKCRQCKFRQQKDKNQSPQDTITLHGFAFRLIAPILTNGTRPPILSAKSAERMGLGVALLRAGSINLQRYLPAAGASLSTICCRSDSTTFW
jgi:hypothetical protein